MQTSELYPLMNISAFNIHTYFNIVDGRACFQVECKVLYSNCIRKIKGIIAGIENTVIKRCLESLLLNMVTCVQCAQCVYTTIIHLF